MAEYRPVPDEEAALALIHAKGLNAVVSPIMGGTFYYPPGSPTGAPYYEFGWYPAEPAYGTAPASPARLVVRDDILKELTDG